MGGYCATGSTVTRQRAGQRDEDRQHGGEDRPVDEEPGDHSGGEQAEKRALRETNIAIRREELRARLLLIYRLRGIGAA